MNFKLLDNGFLTLKEDSAMPPISSVFKTYDNLVNLKPIGKEKKNCNAL
jgi:hypothetical protein